MVLSVLAVVLSVILMVNGGGLLLLYQPKDITNDCAFSRQLRYDISFGMGMSDTITLVFRTLTDIDYECVVEIVASSNQYLIVVVRYPTPIRKNCDVNRDAMTILKKRKCTRLCDLLIGEAYGLYFTFTVRNRLRFLFKSNSSINFDVNANFYQVTITSARRTPIEGCNRKNETICTVDESNYCFTTGVVCDGIKNCGVDDWSHCTLPVQRLGYAPIVAVMAVFICAVVAGGHTLIHLLPPHANSFFVFNENEDNRLYIDPILVPRGMSSRWLIEVIKYNLLQTVKENIVRFDERKSQCTLPEQRLGYAPIVAVMAVFICAVVAGGHALIRLLPPHANSFFVFNENEDNRLCIDPILVPRGNAPDIEAFKRVSIIPVLGSISESENDTTTEELQITEKEQKLHDLEGERNKEEPEIQKLVIEEKPEPATKSTMKLMTEKIQKFQKFMSSRYVASEAGPSRANKDVA